MHIATAAASLGADWTPTPTSKKSEVSAQPVEPTDLEEYGIRILIAEFVKFRRNDLAGTAPCCGIVHNDKGTSGGLNGLVEGVE